MKRYSIYKFYYKGLYIEYYIAELTFYKGKANVLKARIKNEKLCTIKRLEQPLPKDVKLNVECQEDIEKYIKDFCDWRLSDYEINGKN